MCYTYRFIWIWLTKIKIKIKKENYNVNKKLIICLQIILNLWKFGLFDMKLGTFALSKWFNTIFWVSKQSVRRCILVCVLNPYLHLKINWFQPHVKVSFQRPKGEKREYEGKLLLSSRCTQAPTYIHEQNRDTQAWPMMTKTNRWGLSSVTN